MGIPELNEIPPNHVGARYYNQAVKKYLTQEIQAGSVIGPFLKDPFDSFTRVSPLNTREKPDSKERRVVSDLSFPENNAVNDYILKGMYLGEARQLKYPSVDSLVELIQKKGRGCHIFKRDLKRAYRQMYIDLADLHLLGFIFEGLWYFDTTLTMGMRSSADICQHNTDAIMYMYGKQGYDDMAVAEQVQCTQIAFDTLEDVLKSLQIQESVSKA